jgi:hypothetical protein
MALLLGAIWAAPAAATVATACAGLGDGIGNRSDHDTFRIRAGGADARITLEARADTGNGRALVRAGRARRRGSLPLSLDLSLDGAEQIDLSVRQLSARARLGWRIPPASRASPSCR